MSSFLKEDHADFVLLQLLNKASKTESTLQATADETGGEYEYYTRKAWVIENILLERQGFFPEK